MTNWITNEYGAQIFTHEGWEVRIRSPECKWNRIQVFSPYSYYGVEVEVWETGIWVKGWEGPPTSAVTIPWPVIGAIAEARAIITD